MYARIENGNLAVYPYSLRQLKTENPQVSFPENLTPELLASFGVVTVVESSIPTHDPETQSLQEGTPQLADGQWVRTWAVLNRPQEDVDRLRTEKRQRLKLSFVQLLTGLVAEGWITEQEGEAWLEGTLPIAVTNLLSTLPANQRFAARAKASRPSEVLRLDPLVSALALAQNKTPEQLDSFFETYSEGTNDY